MAAWASPLHFRVNAGCRTGTKLRTELQWQDEQKWEWSVKRHTPRPGGNTVAKSASSDDKRPDKQKFDRTSPKNETASNTLSNDSRPVPPKGSVLLQHCGTKRSVAVQAADSVEREDSLWDWLTTSTTTTAATRQPQKRCSSGAPSNINLGWNSRDFSAAFSGLTRFVTGAGSYRRARPTAVLEQLRDRIKATALDMSLSTRAATWNGIHPERPMGLPDLPSADEPPRQFRKRRQSARRRSGVAGLDERGDLTSGHPEAQSKSRLLLRTG